MNQIAVGTQLDDFSTEIEDISDTEAHLADIKIPNNFKESQNASKKENWCSAMKEELEILKARDVYEIDPRPQNKNVIKCIYPCVGEQVGIYTQKGYYRKN
ncbi:hypothetical protein AVEN_81188-1 [Araneus ventricosus]|uniref:Uncharacterized protein n=1 Tax=Araneus ventricosus TaxID=182803 RepID=A0A4Y2M0U8_ARAVE|nr:hypothetical protein AVEN_81188-1 [Araneus ventricosus]